MASRCFAALGAVCAAAFLSSWLPEPSNGAPTPKPSASPRPTALPARLTLSDAEDIALASSPTLVAARAAVNQAQAGVDLAASAAQPNVSLAAASTRSKSSFRTGTTGGTGTGGPGVPTSGGGTASQLFTSNNAAFDLRQLVLDGGRIRAQVSAARYTTDAARLSLRRQFDLVAFTVAQAYFTALQARHQLDTAKDSLRLAQSQASLVQAQFRAGLAARADVLTAQLPVAQAQLAIAQASNGERTQLAALLNAMGVPAQSHVSLVDDTAVSRSVPTLQDVLDVAQRERPDLLAARASLLAAGENVRAARLQRFPLISATASNGLASTNQNGTQFGNNFSVGLGLSLPIFDGGAINAQTAIAQAQADTSSANLTTTELLVSLNVQQGYLGLQTAQAGIVAANAELAQARTVLAVTNAQYRAGVTTLPLLLNAQVGLARAETDQVNALYAYKTAQQQLLFAEGVIGSR